MFRIECFRSFHLHVSIICSGENAPEWSVIQNLDAGKNILAHISWKEFSDENFVCSLQTLKNQS